MANTLKFGNGEWYGKKDTILAYNSENNNYKPLPFNFSRGSSATVINKDDLIETVGSGQPRVDYKDNSKGALLLEPSRSNFVTYSNDFSSVQWNKESGVVVTDNYGISPDGTQNSTRLQLNALNKSIYYGNTVGSASIFSIYIKGIQGEIVRVSNNGGTLHTFTGGWDRVECYDSVGNAPNVNINSYGGSTTALDMEIYGAQLEEASYPTSYIPTQGSAVTRLADICDNGGNEQVINSTEGVLYLNTATLVNTQTTDNSITLTDGGNNKILFRYRGVNNINVKVFVNGIPQAETTHTLTNATEFNKIAIKWKLNDYKIYVNGINVFTDNDALVFPINSINSLGFADGTSTPLFGKVIEVKLYDTALSDEELEKLTTI